ncbi:hypothetical protein GE061_018588 [Apolygus lucorum]|uniref:RNA-directed RNA polymerase C-terminal domain-containing protein n=1 Tax=Apolygus lucorum TaxID=248454 RepID=A0A8S9XEC9_APOLU|nr:hypothetical protein GE061_018588 [Apolygus lucorum]
MNDKTRTFSSMLEPLPNGAPFPFNYQPSRIDRNALFALNRVFPMDAVASSRTQLLRSHLTLEALKEDLFRYDRTPTSRHVSPAYALAVASVIQDLDILKGTLIPLTHGAVAKHPNIPKTKSPGFPYKERGYKNKGEALADPKVLCEIRCDWYSVERNAPVVLPDSACYARAQLCDRSKNKIRATWGIPLTVYLTEGQYFYPFRQHLKQLEHPIIAYGLEMATGGMQYVNTAVAQHHNRYVQLCDWRSFDKTIPAWLVRDAFNICATAFDWSKVQDVEGKIWPVDPVKSKRRWRKLVNYFIDTPVRLSTGERFIKHIGVPSGSCWTNVIDSIVNAIVMRYLIYELTDHLPLFDVYLGDDSVIILPELFSLERLAELAAHYFGMELNTDKSYITQNPANVFFLGYFNENGHPTKPIDSIVASSIYPERPVRNKIDTVTRLIGQAYSTFEPIHATQFFKAAKILANEENLSNRDLEEWIHDHPANFKFLSTLGVDARTITIPDVDEEIPTWITQPSDTRREYIPRQYILEDLYQQGLLFLEWDPDLQQYD